MKIKLYDFEHEATAEELAGNVFDIYFMPDYRLRLDKIDGVWQLTNAVNGWGNNCFEDVKDKVIITPPQQPEPQEQQSAEEILIQYHYLTGQCKKDVLEAMKSYARKCVEADRIVVMEHIGLYEQKDIKDVPITLL